LSLPASEASNSSAGGQEEHAWLVKSSTTTGRAKAGAANNKNAKTKNFMNR
jgi:hypothetical protein